MKALHIIYMCALATLALALPARAADQEEQKVARQYTDERPVCIGVQWYLAPYEFNRGGEATGFNVEVMRAALDDAGLPYKFIFRSNDELVADFNDGKIDIMVDLYDGHHSYKGTTYHTTTVLGVYKPRVAYRKGTRPIHSLRELLPDDTLALKPGDYTDLILRRDSAFRHSQTIYDTPKVCINKLLTGHCRYFVWGEKCVARSIAQLGLDESIVVDSIDVPPADIRIVGHDQGLIRHLDRHLAQLDQAGELYKLNIKWFHPERLPNPLPWRTMAVIAALALAIAGCFVVNRRINRKIDRNMRQVRERGAIFNAAITMSNRSLEYFSLERKRIYNICGHHVPDDGMDEAEYQSHVHPDDIDELNQFVLDIISGKKGSKDKNIFRWNRGSKAHPKWVTMEHYASLESDDRGNPVNVICAINDITDQMRIEAHHDEVEQLLKDTGDNAPVGLQLYDGTGRMLRTNHAMADLLNLTGPDDPLACTNLYDLPSLGGVFDRTSRADTSFCCQISIPERGVSKYVENHIKPITDDRGQLRYVLLSRHDATKMREAYLEQRRNTEKIRMQNIELRQLEENIRQLLHANAAREWRSDFGNGLIHFYGFGKLTDTITMRLEQLHKLCDAPENIAKVNDFFNPADREAIDDKTILIKGTTHVDDAEYAGRWYNISRVPQYDNHGHIKGCFGLLHDVTEHMTTLEKLKDKTRKANESEKMKSVFLANMTHEIRTPLNAIVGFCDLLQSVEGAERQELIDIIHNNCNMLVHLINDILTVSEMETTGLSINPREVNFGRAFSEVCSTLAQTAEGKGLKLVAHNPFGTLVLNVDNERLQQVVINFGTNAIKHTTQGQIDIGYELVDGGLRIYCRDTGSGMPKDRLNDIFERFVKLNDFVQGTGLGLNICKAIADACHGKIGVESEEGIGSNFWIWIPCEVKNV